MKPARVISAALLLAGGAVLFAAAVPAYADIILTDPPEGAPTNVCAGGDSGKIDVDEDEKLTSITITAPAGKLITGFCVKAGAENQGDGPKYFVVDPPQASVVITHPTDKEISHYSYSTAPIVPPTTPPATTPPATTPPATTPPATTPPATTPPATTPPATTPPATTPPATTPPATTPPATTPPTSGGGDGDANLADTGFETGWLPFVGIGALALGAAIGLRSLVSKRR